MVINMRHLGLALAIVFSCFHCNLFCLVDTCDSGAPFGWYEVYQAMNDALIEIRDEIYSITDGVIENMGNVIVAMSQTRGNFCSGGVPIPYGTPGNELSDYENSLGSGILEASFAEEDFGDKSFDQVYKYREMLLELALRRKEIETAP